MYVDNAEIIGTDAAAPFQKATVAALWLTGFRNMGEGYYCQYKKYYPFHYDE